MYADIFMYNCLMINGEKMREAGIRYVSKYVDDIFFIGRKGKWEKVIESLGKDMGLELKVKKEGGEGVVEFLDVKIGRRNGKIESMRNRKSYTSDREIHKQSTQHEGQKRETNINNFNRTIRVPSN